MNSRPALAFAAAEFRASETGAPSIHYPENYQYYFSNFLKQKQPVFRLLLQNFGVLFRVYFFSIDFTVVFVKSTVIQ